MTGQERFWPSSALDPAARRALERELAPTELWSLLLGVLEARAAGRTPAAVRRAYERDRFVQPSIVDQRTLNEVDAHLLAAARQFEALELSPLTPLGSSSAVAPTSQNRVVSTTRGTELVSDPTNVLALECSIRLGRDPNRVVRIATSHRCVRAQPVPDRPGYSPHFRMFCLATAGLERKDHGFITDAVTEQIRTFADALDRLEQHGHHFPGRTLRLQAAPERRELAERIAGRFDRTPTTVEPLQHPYYDGGLRFQFEVTPPSGDPLPLIDGGAFSWVGTLAANRKLVFVAGGMGSQLAAVAFRRD